MSRTAARETCARLIYQWELNGGTWRQALECSIEDSRLDKRDMPYIEDVMENVPLLIDPIDKVIVDISERWRIERMGRMDLAILRLAVYEIGWIDLGENMEIPMSVSINEAIELAKIYGSDDTPSFINGMLSTLAKKLKADPNYFAAFEKTSKDEPSDEAATDADSTVI